MGETRARILTHTFVLAYARTHARTQETRVETRRRGCARCDAMCDEPAGDVQELWMWCWWFWWGADATHPVCAFRATRVWRCFRSTCPGFVPSRPDHLQSDLREPNEQTSSTSRQFTSVWDRRRCPFFFFLFFCVFYSFFSFLNFYSNFGKHQSTLI